MDFLIEGITHLTWERGVMFVVGALLIWLGIKKGYEPALLIPMGFGAILVNFPFSAVLNQTIISATGKEIHAAGIIDWLFNVGIDASEMMPILLFICIGAMIDFGGAVRYLFCHLDGGSAWI